MTRRPTTVNGLRLRHILGRQDWSVPQPYGEDGWRLRAIDGNGMVIVSAAPWDDGVMWIHASMARAASVPSYADLQLLHRAAFGEHGFSYQVFPPRDAHINIHDRVLHLWGRADGQPVLPDFGRWGTI
ncbi:hypothetical protein [Actinokineospora sp. UTMC 2448]|uniref:DUF7694 domain-containing protein n=1 Tax=Actinokineospora sp. UTMC 2448 TaxID=2268449 RepID=UPI00216443F0|nr:hypothetical protein [Actinokineospora sp. UTMC 2448]